jgi:hypothetical protein
LLFARLALALVAACSSGEPPPQGPSTGGSVTIATSSTEAKAVTLPSETSASRATPGDAGDAGGRDQ